MTAGGAACAGWTVPTKQSMSHDVIKSEFELASVYNLDPAQRQDLYNCNTTLPYVVVLHRPKPFRNKISASLACLSLFGVLTLQACGGGDDGSPGATGSTGTAGAAGASGAPGAAGVAGAGVTWVNVTGTSVQAAGDTGYIANNATAAVVVTLPVNPALGDVIEVSGAGKGGWRIAQNAGQSIVAQGLPGFI